MPRLENESLRNTGPAEVSDVPGELAGFSGMSRLEHSTLLFFDLIPQSQRKKILPEGSNKQAKGMQTLHFYAFLVNL